VFDSKQLLFIASRIAILWAFVNFAGIVFYIGIDRWHFILLPCKLLSNCLDLTYIGTD